MDKLAMEEEVPEYWAFPIFGYGLVGRRIRAKRGRKQMGFGATVRNRWASLSLNVSSTQS